MLMVLIFCAELQAAAPRIHRQKTRWQRMAMSG
nr:MAG TPA: hypothetical protein [Caudoviricetes sp.]